MSEVEKTGKPPLWLIWSLATVALWGVWGLVSKVASAGVDSWVNQILYTGGVLPLLVIFFFRTRGERSSLAADQAGLRTRRTGAGWAFFT